MRYIANIEPKTIVLMAYVINPDGTITTVEADYDRNGNIKIKRGYSFEKDSMSKSYNTIPSYTKSRKKKKAKKQNTVASPRVAETASTTVVKKVKRNVLPKFSAPKNAAKKVKRVKEVETKISHIDRKRIKTFFITIAEIDSYFEDKIASGIAISQEVYLKIRETLPEGLKRYFISKYQDYIKKMGSSISASKAILVNDTSKNIKKVAHDGTVDFDINAPSRTGYTLGEIATFSSMHKRTPDEEMVNGKPLYGASRNPKYGYARDRFGRVQERDCFNEDLRNEFENAQRHQNNYDYSSYDENDDNDGAYSDWK